MLPIFPIGNVPLPGTPDLTVPGIGAFILRARNTWSVRALIKVAETTVLYGSCFSILKAVCIVYGVRKSLATCRIVCRIAKPESADSEGTFGYKSRIAEPLARALETTNCC